jgi:hypothetical protein
VFNGSSGINNLRIESFIASNTVEELCMPLNASGNIDPTPVMKEISQMIPTLPSKNKKTCGTLLLFLVRYTGEESSAIFAHAELTKRQYLYIREEA